MKRCLCSIDEGPCHGCEQYATGTERGRKFVQKSKLYINFLAQKPDGTAEVFVLSQGNGPKSVTPQLLEMAGEYGSITNRAWKIKRTGSGQKNTSYTLTPLDKDDIAYNVNQHTVFDLEKVVRVVEYEKQAAFFAPLNQELVSLEDISHVASLDASREPDVW